MLLYEVLLETALTLRTNPLHATLSIVYRNSLLEVLVLKDSLEGVVVDDTVARAAMLSILLQKLLVHDSTLFSTEILVGDYTPYNVVLVEWAHPALRDLVLYLVFDLNLVWTFCESRLHRLLMKLVELIIESGYHILDFC